MTPNAYYPLPADYETLTEAGQRKARLWVLRRQRNPRELVEAWDFFRRVYLRPADETGLIFYKRLTNSAPFHYLIPHDMGKFALNVWHAPRGSAKSTVGALEMPMLLALTRPAFNVGICWATDRMVERRFETFQEQLTTNKLIRDDFGVLKPKHGTGTWNKHTVSLTNQSRLEGFAVMGKQRGARPDLYVLDDPEYDPTGETDKQRLLAMFETMLFRVIIPMLDDGCGAFWLGTILGKQAALYRALKTGRDSDKRFLYWNRRLISATGDLQFGGATAWPEKFTPEWLEQRKGQIGAAAFAAEYEGRPISDTDRTFKIDENLDGYTVDGEEPTAMEQPLTCPARILYTETPSTRPDGNYAPGKEIVEAETSASELFKHMFRFITTDTAWTVNARSDYSCIWVLGIERTTLWLLDCWAAKVMVPDFIRTLFQFGLRWQPKVVAIESEGLGASVHDQYVEYADSLGSETMWKPRVIPVRYPRSEAGPALDTKARRILRLAWRFEQHRIKFPWHLRDKWPWSQALYQIENFTTDMAMLEKDDIVDALAQSSYVIKASGGRRQAEYLADPNSFEAQRVMYEKTGLPMGSGMNMNDLAPDFLDQLLHHSEEQLEEARTSEPVELFG